MKMKWKKGTSLALALTLSLSMTACGSSSDGSAATDSSSGASADVTTYTVALSGQTTPFNYYDENGELDGYEVAMLKEIDARLDDLQFEYTTTEFASLFAGLDSGQFDLILNNITDKPERREKYLFSETPYYYNHTVIVTNAGTEGITSLEDLAGRKVPTAAGSATDMFLQDYNEKNPDKAIQIDYVEGDAAQNILALYEGRYDAVIYSESYVDAVEKSYGYKFDRYSIPNEEEIQNPAVYILYNKSSTALQQEIDGVLKEMKEDGTLSELCIEYFGKDATEPSSDSASSAASTASADSSAS